MIQPFDPVAAVKYGAFVDAAYAMYDKPESDDPLKQAKDHRIPAEFALVAWITMSDFVGQDKLPRFYGYLAQDSNDQKRFVLALRGTEGIVEWWDDFHAILTPVTAIPNGGRVSSGFLAIYRTLDIIAVDPAQRQLGGGADQSFSDKVAALAAAKVPEIGGGNPLFDLSQSTVTVTGHSLGAALCTLYVMENAIKNVVRNPAALYVRLSARWRCGLRWSFQRYRAHVVADRQRSRHRAETSAAALRLSAR